MQIKHTLPTPEQNTLTLEVDGIEVADIVDCWFHKTYKDEDAFRRVDRKLIKVILPLPIGYEAGSGRLETKYRIWYGKRSLEALPFPAGMRAHSMIVFSLREVWFGQWTPQRTALLSKMVARGESVPRFADMSPGLKDGLNLHALQVPTRVQIEYGLRHVR